MFDKLVLSVYHTAQSAPHTQCLPRITYVHCHVCPFLSKGSYLSVVTKQMDVGQYSNSFHFRRWLTLSLRYDSSQNHLTGPPSSPEEVNHMAAVCVCCVPKTCIVTGKSQTETIPERGTVGRGESIWAQLNGRLKDKEVISAWIKAPTVVGVVQNPNEIDAPFLSLTPQTGFNPQKSIL